MVWGCRLDSFAEDRSVVDFVYTRLDWWSAYKLGYLLTSTTINSSRKSDS